MKKQLRQGDVLLEEVEIIKTKKTKNSLLVRGEGRNHGHFIQGDVQVYEGDQENEYFIDVKTEGSLKHLLIDSMIDTKEHKEITVPKGKYRVIRQVEYNPYEKEIRKVED